MKLNAHKKGELTVRGSEGIGRYPVLKVNQNPNYREILKALLEKRGHMVTALEDGYQIGNVLKGKSFDIIFLDSCTGGIRNKSLFGQRIGDKCVRIVP